MGNRETRFSVGMHPQRKTAPQSRLLRLLPGENSLPEQIQKLEQVTPSVCHQQPDTPMHELATSFVYFVIGMTGVGIVLWIIGLLEKLTKRK